VAQTARKAGRQSLAEASQEREQGREQHQVQDWEQELELELEQERGRLRTAEEILRARAQEVPVGQAGMESDQMAARMGRRGLVP